MKNEITKFNTAHVKSVVAKIAGEVLTTWSDGTYIVVSAGEGKAGDEMAAKIIASCKLHAKSEHSKILGSIAELEKKEAAGLFHQTFVLIEKAAA